MDKNYFFIAKWIAEYLSRKEDSGSLPELEEWRKETGNEKLIQKIEKDSRIRLEKRRYDDFPLSTGWESLQKKYIRMRRSRVHQWTVGIAAIFMISLGAALFFGLQIGEKQNAVIPVVVQNIEPGRPKARLILDNGKEIDLEKQQGYIGDTLAPIRNVNNCLAYRTDPQAKHTPVYHELVIPACGEYQLQLCDGTIVYLNAMTKLRFPNYFDGNTREVELEGEAYFKVAKNPEQPFVVKSANSVVYVYGTQFNISAYPGESNIHTTLVEGKLAVENSGQRREIRPGEQWCYHKANGKVTVEKVDVTLYTAWKDGRFRFNDARLDEIMQVVSRWYGVVVSYQSDDLKDLRFGCNFNRHSSIEPLLRVFEANNKIKIEQNGNQLKIRRGH